MANDNLTRDQYLKELLKNKRTIEQQGGSLVNPSLTEPGKEDLSVGSNPIQQDLPNVSPLQQTSVTEDLYKNSRNGWQRIWDTVGNFVHNINEGVQKYVLDPIADAGIYLYGLVSNDQEGAREAMNYDWGAHYLNVIDQLDFGTNLMNGNIFNGQYFANWADMGNIQAERQNFSNLKESSFMSEASPDIQQGFETGEQIFGAILPSILVGIFTAGSSVGAQAAALGISTGVAGVSGFGRGVTEALGEGAEYAKAGAYGAIRGVGDAALTFVGGKVAGQLLGGGAGTKVANAMFGKTGNVLLSNVAKIATNAGISGATRFVDEALLKPAEKLVYDEQSWIKSYGDNSATTETLRRAKQAGLTAVAMSVLSQTISESLKVAIEGKDKYVSNFAKQYDYSRYKKEYKTMNEEVNKISSKMSEISTKLEAYQKDLQAGNISEADYNKVVKPLLSEFNTLQAQGNDISDKFINLQNKEAVEIKFGEQFRSNREEVVNKITSAYKIENASKTAIFSKYLTKFFDEGWTYDDVQNAVKNFNGNESFRPTNNGYQLLTYKNGNQTVSVPLMLEDKALVPTTVKQMANSLILVGKGNIETANIVTMPITAFVKTNIELPKKQETLVIPQEVATKITDTYNSEQIKEFLDLANENKGKTVIRDGNRYIIVANNDNGKTLVTYVDSKFKNITAMKYVETGTIKPSSIASTKVAADKVDAELSEALYLNEAKYVKAFGEMNHERVISMKKSKDIVDIARKQIFDKIVKKDGYTYKLDTPVGKLTREIFEAYDGDTKDLPLAIDEIATEIAESKLTAISPTGVKIESVAGHKEDLVKAITGLLEAKSELSKVAKLEKRIDLTIAQKNKQIAAIRERADTRLQRVVDIFTIIRKDLKAQVSENKNRIAPSRTIRGLKKDIPATLRKDLKWSEDTRTYNAGSLLIAPFMKLKSNANGYSAGKLSDDTILKDELDKILGQYTAESWDNDYMPFDDNLRDDIEDFRNSLREPEIVEIHRADGRTETQARYPSLTAEQLRAVARIMKEIRTLSHRASENKQSTYAVLSHNGRDGFKEAWSGKFNPYSWYTYNTASSYAIIQSGLGNSSFANELTTGMQNVYDKYLKYTGDLIRQQNDKVEELKIKNKLAEYVSFRGIKLQYDSLVDVYNALNNPVDFERANQYGYDYADKKGQWKGQIFAKGQAEEALNQLEEILPDNMKEYANWLKDTLNGKIKKDYADTYFKRYGVEPNTVSDGNYWMRSLYAVKASSVEALVRSPRFFSHKISRRDSVHPYIAKSATMAWIGYVDGIATEMLVMPKYRELLGVLNYKDDYDQPSLYETIDKRNRKFAEYIMETLNMWVGVNPNNQGKGIQWMNTLMGNYTLSVLSANFGTPLKQPLSALMSNFSFVNTAKSVKSAFIHTKEYEDEFKYLHDQMGAVLYRANNSRKNDVDLSVGLQRVMNNIKKGAEFMAKFISIADQKTINIAGLRGSMDFALAQGFELGSPEFRAQVVETFADFIMSQIGTNPNNLSRLARGDWGIVGSVLNFLQGPSRAAVASYKQRIDTLKYVHNHKLTEESVKNKLSETKKSLDESLELLKEKQEAEAKLVSEREDIENADDLDKNAEEIKKAHQETENAQREANSKEESYKKAQNDERMYKRYKALGGKSAIIQSVLELVVYGVLVSLINDANKKLKGSREWNEFDVNTFIQDSALNATVGWLPIVNSISNSFKGYDTTYPVGELLNLFTSLISDIGKAIESGGSESALKTLLRDGIAALSMATGLPFKNLYNYFYGLLKNIDYGTAMKINNLFYTMSASTATKSYNSFVKSGNSKKGIELLDFMMTSYKGQESNEQVNKEIYYLSTQGYNALPKTVPSQYKDADGNSVNLSAEQIAQFTKLYTQASKVMTTLVGMSDYKNMTAEEKSKTIRSLYDNYYDFAKASTFSLSGGSKLVNVLVMTNGNIDMAKYIVYLQKVSTISENKAKTRKELVIEYINRLSGLTKAEKTLLMYLAGYSVKDSSKSLVINLLTKSGANYKSVKQLFE